MHLSSSADWGSPPEVVDLARLVLGRIDLDPASSEFWNDRPGGVDARVYMPRDGLSEVWRPAGQRPVTVFLNAPGDRSGQLVKAFWSRLVREWAAGVVDSAIWIGFSLEQLVSCQHEPVNPVTLPMLVPRRRLSYLRRGTDGSAVPADQPTHGSYVTLLPSSDPARGRAQMATFAERGAALGTVRL
jgi:hypothetical protein